jgi:hypothetical protein
LKRQPTGGVKRQSTSSVCNYKPRFLIQAYP